MAKQTSPSTVDLEPSAAFRLGFFTRHFDATILSELIHDLRTKIGAYDFDKLTVAVGVLARPGATDEIDDYRDSLSLAADRIVGSSYLPQSLYDLGAALGNYYTQRLELADPVDATPVWACVRRLPGTLTANGGCLLTLVREDKGSRDLEAAMRRAIAPWAEKLKPDEDDFDPRHDHRRPDNELPSFVRLMLRSLELTFVSNFVRELCQELNQSSDALESSRQSGGGSDSQTAGNAASSLSQKSQKRPRNLGLDFDEERRLVWRAGFGDGVELTALHWELFLIFNEFGTRPASRKAISQAWPRAGLAEGEARIDDALTDFRDAIEPLGAKTKSSRGLGWTLILIEPPPIKKATKKPDKKVAKSVRRK